MSEIIENTKHYDGVTLVERMKECHVPGISIALIENFELIETYVHGFKRRETEDKVTSETLFQAASISKPVFAVAIMRLVEQGILDIEMDISEYLTDYEVPTFDNEKYKITLKQLLSHHAGLNLHGFAGYQQHQEIPTVAQILTGGAPSNHLKLKLMKQPDTEFRYSGGGYVLAQKIMTDICKLDFCQLMDDLILFPFSMKQSTYLQPLPKDRIGEIAFGYNEHNLQIPGGFDTMPELSAAGLWSTPTDLARFGIEMMKAWGGESSLLKEDTTRLMMEKATKDSPYGIGFAVNQREPGLTFGHSGSNDGFKANMCFCPVDGSGLVVMHNSEIGWFLVNEVTEAFKEAYGW